MKYLKKILNKHFKIKIVIFLFKKNLKQTHSKNSFSFKAYFRFF